MSVGSLELFKFHSQTIWQRFLIGIFIPVGKFFNLILLLRRKQIIFMVGTAGAMSLNFALNHKFYCFSKLHWRKHIYIYIWMLYSSGPCYILQYVSLNMQNYKWCFLNYTVLRNYSTIFSRYFIVMNCTGNTSRAQKCDTVLYFC